MIKIIDKLSYIQNNLILSQHLILTLYCTKLIFKIDSVWPKHRHEILEFLNMTGLISCKINTALVRKRKKEKRKKRKYE